KLVDVRVRPHELLDAPRIDDHAANLLHVVEPAEHPALERGQGAPARAAPIGQLHDVARPIAQERHGLAIEAGEDQLAARTRLDRPVLLVEHLGGAVVLVHVREPRARLALPPPRAAPALTHGPRPRAAPAPAPARAHPRPPTRRLGAAPTPRPDPRAGRRDRRAGPAAKKGNPLAKDTKVRIPWHPGEPGAKERVGR